MRHSFDEDDDAANIKGKDCCVSIALDALLQASVPALIGFGFGVEGASGRMLHTSLLQTCSPKAVHRPTGTLGRHFDGT
jgi:hypothetical protein